MNNSEQATYWAVRALDERIEVHMAMWKVLKRRDALEQLRSLIDERLALEAREAA